MTQAFNLSQFANKVNTSGQADLTTAVTGALPVANGGSGQTTYTNGQLLIGNTTGGTLTKSTLTAGSGITITNGAGSITIAAGGGSLQTQIFTAPGTWTKPASATQVRVTVVGGGGASVSGITTFGGAGGVAIAICPVSAPVSVTVGAGASGFPETSAGTSSFGALVSATGGANSSAPTPANPGTGTVSTGTALKTTNVLAAGSFINQLAGLTLDQVNPGGPFPTANQTYTTSSGFIAGAAGQGKTSPSPQRGGWSGAVVVEFVG